MQIGAQFFTLRDFCKTPEALAESLKRVADIGYRTVQLSAVCPFDPEWMREQLAANGLRCVLTHTPADRLLADPAQVAAEHEVYGCPNVGLGWYGFVKDGHTTEDFIRLYKPVAAALKENGKYFMHHNHDQELAKENGRRILEILSEAFAPDEMGFTLDTYWIQVGGGDPAQWIEDLTGRVPCIHLKDCGYGRRMDCVGEGNINFDRVFKAAEAAGTQTMLVEQDDCNGEDPFDCLKRSYDYLKACGFH